MGFCLAYLHLIMAHSRGQVKVMQISTADVVNDDRYGKITLPSYRKLRMGFRFVYLHSTMAISKG